MKQLFKKYNCHFLLTSIGISWIVFLNYVLQINTQKFQFPDTLSYLIASENLYKLQLVDAGRPTLIMFIHGFPYLFGFSKWALFSWNFVVNCISWLLIITLLFEILKSFANQKSAFVFTLIYIFTIGSAVINFHVLSETIFTLFLFASLYYFHKFYLSKRFIFLSVGFSLLILSVLIKPVSLVILFFILLFYTKPLLKNIKNRWSLLIFFSFMALFFHLVLMKNQFGNYTISYIDSFTYYNYLGTRAEGLKTNAEFVQCDNARFDYFTSLSLSEQKNEAFKDFKTQLTTNKWNLCKAYFINIYTNSFKGCQALFEYKNNNKTSYFEASKFFFRAASLLQNALFTIIGISLSVYFLLQRKKRNEGIVIASFTIIYIFLISGISSEQGDRFHLVFYPQIIVLAAYFLKDKVSKFKIVKPE